MPHTGKAQSTGKEPRKVNRPTVSVIIPTFNRSGYITEAIESVLNQTYKDIEIIVVDDGSTDDTAERLKPYEEKIRYIRTENGGPASARNAGMKEARGKYVSFLDSDDLYYPYKTELQVNFLDMHHDVAMVCTELSAVSDTKMLDEFHLKKYHRAAYAGHDDTYEKIFSRHASMHETGLELKGWEEKKVYIGHVFDRYYKELILSTNTVMFRRELFDRFGGQHEPYWYFEDYEFLLRIAKHHNVAFIDVPTYKLRYHNTQLSTTWNKPNGTEILVKKYANLIEIAEKHGLHDADYYTRNKAAVDGKLHALNRSAAVLLMKTSKDAKRARTHLMKCSKHKKNERALWALSHAPLPLRKVSFKIGSLLSLVNVS